jgi:hypothetical protein
VTAARRRDPAADHAAQAIVIYDLQRPGAPDLPKSPARAAMRPHEATTELTMRPPAATLRP